VDKSGVVSYEAGEFCVRRNLSIYLSHQMHTLIMGSMEENQMPEHETLMLGKENACNILL
jgi:hypothetical protein